MNYLQRCSCGFTAVLPSCSQCPTCTSTYGIGVKMTSCIPFNTGAPMDQLVCLSCGHRSNSRHNIACQTCEVMMVYESAWAKPELYKQEYAPHLVATGEPAPEPVQAEPEKPQEVEAPMQLGLFGAA